MSRAYSNKTIGTEFEQNFCDWLSRRGWWVHFIAPDNRGAQPFDVIAAKDRRTMVVDCKTSSRPIFSIDRLEENQKLAFEKWLSCGNSMPIVAILYKNNLYLESYRYLKEKGKIDLRYEIRSDGWDIVAK